MSKCRSDRVRRFLNRRPVVECLEGRQLLAVDFVITISVDGLRPDAITQLGPSLAPNFYRLRTQGSFTDNARTDFDYSVTLPNHTSMMTGRPVLGAAGHGWSTDIEAPATTTISSNKKSYVASAWDVAHDNGKRTGLFASKTKFDLYTNSYDADTAPLQGGAPDVTGVDNGRDKIDVSYINVDQSAMTDTFVADMIANPINYSLLHYQSTDNAGHGSGWMSNAYLIEVKNVDAQLGKIFRMIDTHANLAGHTDIILTTDHGGSGKQHTDPTNALDYTIPFYVWGAGVTAGGDLYTMNPTSLLNPGGGRPANGTTNQPLRTGDVANLGLDLLNLPPVPGSSFDVAQNIIVNGAVISNQPAAPTNLVATSVSATQINLTWTDNATNETGYRIERSTDGVNFAALAGGGSNIRAYNNTGLAAGHKYYYRVYAVNGTVHSGFSNVASAVAGQTGGGTPTPPAAPSSLSASAAGSSSINLAWADNSTNETGFSVERSTNGVNFAAIATVGANVRNYSSTGLAAGTKYYYRVRALGTSGNSGYTNTASATTQSASQSGVPAAPTNLTVAKSTSVANAINLSWIDNASNETAYKIERSTDGVHFYALAGGGANLTFYRNTGLSAGRRYYYRVYASNSAGNSPYSNVASLLL